MDAYQAIIAKRDRREYADRPIPEDVLQRILQAGRMAGSSSNSQPCRLIVMRERESLERIGPAGVGTAPLVKAPLGVVIVKKNEARDFDVGRIAQNMMVAAWADGVISCPVGLREEAIGRAALGLPDDWVAAIGIAFGYPAAEKDAVPTRDPRPRIAMEELVHWEKW
jgi:nitroreductase